MPGIIERYRERLPFDPTDPIVSLNEGSTPLILAERLSDRAGVEVWLKIEGANPTGSFKDRGMTCAVSAAVREGAEAVICASTGNTAASAAAYSAKAGLTGAVIVPEGKIATGKLAQALMHGARVVALRGNFDEALKLVRELVSRHPISLVNSVNEFRIEGQKTAAFEIVEELTGELDALCIPVGNAGNITAYWKGFQELGYRPRMCGFQAAGAAPLVEGKPIAHPETVASAIRIGNPARWEEAMNAMTSSGGAVKAVTDARDPRRVAFPGRHRGSVLRARVGGERRRAARPTAPATESAASCACSPATASRTRRPHSSRRGRSCRAIPSWARSSARCSGERRPLAPARGSRSGLLGQPRAGLRRVRGRALAAPRARGA